MKYIDADKLIAEIERQKKELFKIGGDTFENKWACGSLDSIKAFVISLQQEQPEVDLEKEIQDWCKENVTGVNPIYTADSLIYSLLPKTARHFYELGKNARKEE